MKDDLKKTTSPRANRAQRSERIKAIFSWFFHNLFLIISTILILTAILMKGSLFYFVFISHRTETMHVLTRMMQIDEKTGNDGLQKKEAIFDNN